MDEATVRELAEAHGNATVTGDLKKAGSVLDKAAYGAAGEVMKQMPAGLTGCEIVDTRSEADALVVTILYRGTAGSASVESRWSERDGSPKIVDLKAL